MTRTVCLVAMLMACFGVALAGGDKRSPFEMVRYVEGEPQVQVKGEWYALVSIDGIPLERIMEACEKLDDAKPQKRFCEDLPEALEGIGHTMGPTVDLVLRRPKESKKRTFKGVRATERNRDRIKDARPWKPQRAVQRIDREHATKADRRFAFLTIRHHEDEPGPRIDAANAREDLDQLEWLVENVFSYRDLRAFDRHAAFDTLRLGLSKGIAAADFHIQLRKLVALFGDGHSRVPGVAAALPHGPLPFALADLGGRIAAIDQRGRPVDHKHPYVVQIDGRSIREWLDAAGRINARGSPQFQRHMALDTGRRARLVRRELGLQHRDEIEVTLADASGHEKKQRLKLARRRVPVPGVPAVTSELPDGFGYIRIPEMSGRGLDVRRVTKALESFRTDSGNALIIDVRGNGGGTRDILAALMPRLLPADAKPVVCNVAAYRLPPGVAFDEQRGHLDNRMLYPPGSRRLSKDERAAAQALLAGLETDWKPEPPLFTPLHAMVVTPAPKGEARFTGPIALLIDEGCFSATDIFVGALELLPNVTLIGRPTGGGSGRTQRYTLAHSGIEVKLSSMASFRPTGARYDGLGIEPDVRVEQTLGDLAGDDDTVFLRALEFLLEKTKR